jgi:hypothetical protein
MNEEKPALNEKKPDTPYFMADIYTGDWST